MRARAHVECMSQKEAVELARRGTQMRTLGMRLNQAKTLGLVFQPKSRQFDTNSHTGLRTM